MIDKKLGELLYFISEVAISALMNTAYNSTALSNPETPKAAMWLVDMLHNFHGIGKSLAVGNYEQTVKEIESLISIWEYNKYDIQHAISVNEAEPHHWSVDQGIELLRELKKTVLEEE